MSIDDVFSPGRRKFIQSIGTMAAGAALLDAIVWSQDAYAVVDLDLTGYLPARGGNLW